MPLLTGLDIVNAACAQIGETPLQSLDEETDAGQSASLLYQDVVDFNLGLYVWGFAKQIRQLSRDDLTVPLSGFKLVFDLPAERIENPLYLTDDPTDPDRRFYRYQLVGAKVHADEDPLFAMIRFRPDPHNWTATFRAATITSLASRFALSLGHDRATADSKHTEAYGTPSEQFRGGQIGAAIRSEAFTTPPRQQNRDDNPLTAAWRS